MPPLVSRRGILRGAAGFAGLSTTGAVSNLVRRDRPQLTHGVQSGDVTAGSAVVWTRSDRPARMFVQVPGVRTFRGPVLTAKSDFTGRVELSGLPAGESLDYRVVLADPDAHRAEGAHADGLLRTAPRRARDVRFLWSGDQSGQGWGRNPDLGGFPIYRAMLRRDPHFFLHSGDSIYADGPITGDVTLPDGRVYRNVLEEAKSHVAETLDDFRGAHRYNLGDDGMRAFLARTPMVCQWDDHEVSNNWYPGEILDDSRYTEKDIDVLKVRAYRAWTEYQPLSTRTVREHQIYRKVSYGPLLDVFILDMRTYRNDNTAGLEDGGISPDGGILGTEQARWLVRSLAASKATWKVIQADMPIGLVVPDGEAIEAVAQGKPGGPLGRERQIAWILREIKRRRIGNTVWLTADVHYTAAHHYDPARAAFQDFEPFWEFVSGPLHAGAFGPNDLDPTFGPQQVFAATPPRANTSPLEGSQFFGEVQIDGDSRAFTVHLRDLDGTSLWSRTLQAA
ncbi:alkaline phosphatase D family protein [Kineosporia sp. J2-2]|uniref:Alkaline phosphatase D family protein n=1 Tax=Kineosporia corallincola TaxID=2835133 RepID=A0ABS5TI01_9ACTN|nr:alkaline phosphatase D family protein [Kineosporia corallincola]MBT0770712.1 alkaline phosphatase D family protein [Kineosporia corallincola]